MLNCAGPHQCEPWFLCKIHSEERNHRSTTILNSQFLLFFSAVFPIYAPTRSSKGGHWRTRYYSVGFGQRFRFRSDRPSNGFKRAPNAFLRARETHSQHCRHVGQCKLQFHSETSCSGELTLHLNIRMHGMHVRPNLGMFDKNEVHPQKLLLVLGTQLPGSTPIPPILTGVPVVCDVAWIVVRCVWTHLSGALASGHPSYQSPERTDTRLSMKVVFTGMRERVYRGDGSTLLTVERTRKWPGEQDADMKHGDARV